MSAVPVLATRTLNKDAEWMPEREAVLRADRETVVLIDELSGDTVVERPEWLGARKAHERLDANTFRRLADLLLLPASMLHPQERAYATDLLHAAIADVDVDTRGHLAARLARMGETAPSLIARLVRDEDIAVAAPLLRLSQAVTEADLVDILRSGCPDRALIIAGRTVLSAETIGEIADQGDNKVLLTALGNSGAHLDPVTVARLAKRVRDDAVLSEALLQRPEMSPRCALEMFWSLNRKLRLYVLGRFLQDGQAVREILETASGDAVSALPGENGIGRQSDVQARLIAVAEAMAQARAEDAARGLAELACVSIPAASLVAADSGGEAVAVAFKAAGASRTTFADACTLWQKAACAPMTDDADVEEITEQFDRLSRGQARMAMSYWNWSEGNAGPYAPIPELRLRDFGS